MKYETLNEIKKTIDSGGTIGADTILAMHDEIWRLRGKMFELWEEHSHGVLYEDFVNDYDGGY